MAALFEHGVILTLLTVCVFFGECDASGLGSCPKHPLMKDFNITQFTGRWYEVERSFYLMELAARCISFNLEENSKGQLFLSATSQNRWTGTVSKIDGVASPSKRDQSIIVYKVSSRLPNAIAKLLPGAGNYQVLATDYDNYAILWKCSSYGVAHTDLVWILGRKREISVLQRTEIYGFLADLHIDSERLIISKNTNCTDI